MRWSVLLFALLTVIQCLPAKLATAQPPRPNVIIIYTDDQGFGDASCLNPKAKFQTPHLDQLAKEGISFTNGHSSDAVCTPSRYGLLTGRYSWRTRLKRGVMGAEDECLIAPDQSTIASMLQQQGYHTAMVGKWHLGMDFPGTDHQTRDWSQPTKNMPLDHGFDYFYGIPASLNYGVLAWFEGRHAKVPPTLFTAKKNNARHVDYRIMPPYQKTPAKTPTPQKTRPFEVAEDFIDNQCLTRFTDKAIEWMKTHQQGERKSDPFFLYLPYTSPHYPVCPLPEFHGQGECGGYGEFVIETDYHVGRVMKYLNQSGLDKNTMIVFTSDNGPEKSWAGRIQEFAHYSNYIYREGKRSIYEGGHRVPFFVRWPQGIATPGRRYEQPVGQIDLLATIADVTGCERSETDGVDSISFANVLSNTKTNAERPGLINHASSGQFSITRGDWKLVLPWKRKPAELYDLGNDPSETKNLISERPDIAKLLTREATKIVLRGRTTPGPVVPNDTPYWDDLTWIPAKSYRARAN